MIAPLLSNNGFMIALARYIKLFMSQKTRNLKASHKKINKGFM